MVSIVSDPLNAPSVPAGDTRKPHVVVLLDASGSMSSHSAAVVSTFNEYLQSIRGTAHTISLYTFESSGGIREKIFKQDPARVRNLTTVDYTTGAMTPLYDAMGLVMTKFRYEDRPVQFTTHTDGLENHSKEWTKAGLDELIASLTASGWLFTYLMEGLQGRQAMQDFGGLKFAFSPQNRGQTVKAFAASTALYSTTNENAAGTYTADGGDTIDVDKGEDVVSRTVGNTPAE